MNKWQSLLILAVALLAVLGLGGLASVSHTSAATQDYTLDWGVIGGGGNAGTEVSSTVGQAAIGWSTGANQLGSGFWYGVRAGGNRVYLPLMLKNH